jgi:TPR repeat protein
MDEIVDKFAEDQESDMQFQLGQIFEQCNDKAWSQKLTAKWYMQLAKQGYRRAQHRLGCMYAQGFGVPKDYVKAYAWCKISASQHSPRALLQLKEIESQMAADQIHHARKLSKQYYGMYVAPFSQ